jgi:hypothetical protein
MDQRAKGATKCLASISLCRALKTIGVKGIETEATVFLVAPSGQQVKIEGEAQEHWKDTPTFTKFWHTHLGARYGYIKEIGSSGPAEPIKDAPKEVRDRSERPYDPAHWTG